MKDIVSRDVDEIRQHMFDTSVEGVKSRLQEMISFVQRTLTDDANKVFTHIARDYRAVAEQSQNAEERALNAEITTLLTPILTNTLHSGPQPQGDQIGSSQNWVKATLIGQNGDESHGKMMLG